MKYIRLTLLILTISFAAHNVYAQSWQWGKRGGSPLTPVGGVGFDEMVIDMATDRNGNVYTISDVWSPGLDIDGHPKTGFGNSDILISSFKCDGSYRWSKIIGSNQNDMGRAIKTDSLGGVYVTGHLINSASSLYIDADTSWAGGSNKTLFLAKFDTSGTYKWFRMPQPDTTGTYSSANSGSYDIDVDGAGNVYWFCYLAPGAYAGGGYIVPTKSLHVLKYDNNGFFLGGTLMQISFSGNPSPSLLIKRNHENGKYIVTGSAPVLTSLTFGTTPISHTVYVGGFSSTGANLWARQNTSIFSNGPTDRAAIDAEGNIYVSAQAVHSDVFNSYVVNNPSWPGGMPIIVKMDTAGNHIWGTNGRGDAETQTAGIIVHGNEVVMTGAYPAKLRWDNDSIKHTAGCGYSPFTVRLNATTGAVMHLDTLKSGCGDNTRPTSITADRAGNIFIGGYTNNSVTVASITLAKVGGGSDFFLAKYGNATCDCILPTASFTSTGTLTKSFTYTGTATYDSVRWDFGDGGTSTLASPTHTFAVGTYTVCVTVYTSCGSDVHCEQITASTVSIARGSNLRQVTIYPNPANDQLFVDNPEEGTHILIWDIVGIKVYETTATEQRLVIDTRALPAGNYIVQLSNKNGGSINTMILKQ